MRFAAVGSCRGSPVRGPRDKISSAQTQRNAISQRAQKLSTIIPLMFSFCRSSSHSPRRRRRRNFYVIKVWVRERGWRVFAVVILFGAARDEKMRFPWWHSLYPASTYSTFFTAEDFLMSLALSALDFIERDSFRLSPPDKLNLLVARFLTLAVAGIDFQKPLAHTHTLAALTCGTWRCRRDPLARACFPGFCSNKMLVNHIIENWIAEKAFTAEKLLAPNSICCADECPQLPKRDPVEHCCCYFGAEVNNWMW